MELATQELEAMGALGEFTRDALRQCSPSARLFEKYSNRFVVDWFDAWAITDGGPDACLKSGICVAIVHQMYEPGFYTW